MEQQSTKEHSPGHSPEHLITTAELGPFCFARCSCGWRGPARRARSLARTEGRKHVMG
ncbi:MULTISPECIES: hypothetical protein [Streptomyces]|uniref:hypothetical protein n=1 Tax=Streptomyces TaxID=1883 RepID=UPI000A90C4EF|nr:MULTISPECIES: hypothetical protein [Streptomyces]MCP3770928.1 hypothetical protein [Streptomyces sp. MAR25Y5]